MHEYAYILYGEGVSRRYSVRPKNKTYVHDAIFCQNRVISVFKTFWQDLSRPR